MNFARSNVLGVVLVVFCLWVLQGYLGELEFDRKKLLSGEMWRVWTGHLVHTNNYHFALNIVAATMIYCTFLSAVKLGELVLLVFVFSALISVTLLCIYPSLDWYNGLSGLLHALVAYFSVRLAKSENKIFWVGLLIVWAKVLIETLRARTGSEYAIGDMSVITEAHLIGVFFGTLTAFLAMFAVHLKKESKSDDD